MRHTDRKKKYVNICVIVYIFLCPYYSTIFWKNVPHSMYKKTTKSRSFSLDSSSEFLPYIFTLHICSTIFSRTVLSSPIPDQVRFHLCLGFLSPMSTCPDGIPVFLLGHTSLLSLPACFLIPQFKQQAFVQPCWFPASSTSFLMLGNGNLLWSQKGVLKEMPDLFCSCVPKSSIPGDLTQ